MKIFGDMGNQWPIGDSACQNFFSEIDFDFKYMLKYCQCQVP